MKEIISVESLSKDYIIKNRVGFSNTEKTVKQALKDINFSIKEGEIVLVSTETGKYVGRA